MARGEHGEAAVSYLRRCRAHFGEHLILPALWDLSHRNTVQSICFSSDAVIASLLCLRDAKVSHPLYLILSDWMSGNGRRRSCTRYHFLPYYNILLHTAESCRISSEAHVCIHFIMLLPALPHQHGIKSAGTCSTSSQNCRKVNQFEMNKINS